VVAVVVSPHGCAEGRAGVSGLFEDGREGWTARGSGGVSFSNGGLGSRGRWSRRDYRAGVSTPAGRGGRDTLQIAIAGERSAADDPIQSVLGELRAGEYGGAGERR
jgi:hypothetical protein